MTVHDFISKHPDDHIRIIMYTPAPDVLDDHGDLVCGGEGTSIVVFDSTTGEGDLAPDLLLKDVINSPEDEGPDEEGAYELEFMPDEEYWLGG